MVADYAKDLLTSNGILYEETFCFNYMHVGECVNVFADSDAKFYRSR